MKASRIAKKLAGTFTPDEVHYWVKKPHVICFVKYAYEGPDGKVETEHGIGIARVSYPDEFNEDYGKLLAYGRAKIDMAARLLGEAGSSRHLIADGPPSIPATKGRVDFEGVYAKLLELIRRM